MRYTNNNIAVCSFSLAVPRRFKKEGQADVDFINCQAWQKTAEFVTKYFAKGQQVAVVGRIQVRNYETDEGRKVYVTEVIVEETYFADSKKEKGDSHYSGKSETPDASGYYDTNNMDDDDLPF